MNETSDESENLLDVLQGGPTGNPYAVKTEKNERGQYIWTLAAPERIYFSQPFCDGTIADELESATEEILQTAKRIFDIDLYSRAAMIRAFSSRKPAPFAAAVEELRFFPRICIGGDIHFGTGMLLDEDGAADRNARNKIYECCRAPIDNLLKSIGLKISEACNLYPAASEKLIRFMTSVRDLANVLGTDTASGKANAALEDCLTRLKDASASLLQAAKLKPRKRHGKTGKRIKYPGMLSSAELSKVLTEVGKRVVKRTVGEKVVEFRVLGIIKPAALRKIESRYKDPNLLEPRFGYCKAFRLQKEYQTRLQDCIKAWQEHSHSYANELEKYMREHPDNKLSSFRPKKRSFLLRDGNIENRTADPNAKIPGR